MASLEEPCLQIIRRILFCKCPNTCPPPNIFYFQACLILATSNSENLNLQLPRTPRKRWRWRKRQKTRHQQAPSTGGRKHATGSTRGHHQAPGAETCHQKALEAENMLEARGTAPGDEWHGTGGKWHGTGGWVIWRRGGRVTRHCGAWNLTPSPAAPRRKFEL